MGNLVNKSKAQVLSHLATRLKFAKILPQIRFTIEEWELNSEYILGQITLFFQKKKVIIRSSGIHEDGIDFSNAGSFETISNVDSSDKVALKEAIIKVHKSFEQRDALNEIFIQDYLTNVKTSGVVFTREISNLAPYYVINYDDTSSRTDSVTSGTSNELKIFIKYRDAPLRNKKFKNLFKAIREIELIQDNDALDIEFAIGMDDEVFIFQVRVIIIKNKTTTNPCIKKVLSNSQRKFKILNSLHTNLLGNRTFLGVMSDWNPAEIIGEKPKRLALSLYKELITDRIWAIQRYNYGYRDLRSFPLLVTLIGVPFIDLRVSFNSFIPASLETTLSAKLVNYYLDRLEEMPDDHDKVEFDIVYSCYHFGLPKELNKLKYYNFSESEIETIKTALLDLTNHIIDNKNKLYEREFKKLEILEESHKTIMASPVPIIDKVFWLIENCKKYGTLPFAGIARCGFMAVQFLNSFITNGIIDKEEYDQFMNSLNTVSKQLSNSLQDLKTGKIGKEEFLKKYGHLRPGTYDIMSLRYDEDFDFYFSGSSLSKVNHQNFNFTQTQLDLITRLLVKNKIDINVHDLLYFIKKSIEGREYIKFIFTKTLSDVLVLLEDLGRKYCFSREQIAYLDIKTILNLYDTVDHRNLKTIIASDIKKNISYYKYTKTVKFPPLIFKKNQIYEFLLEKNRPNFITQKKCTGQIISEQNFHNISLKAKIVFIESADPGYDWIFSHNIAGLITLFGGANSHMAIRCAELGLPAVIGAGKILFDSWLSAEVLELDALNKKVLKLR